MSLVGLPPAFVPPVVVAPAANAIVPFIAGSAAAGGGAAVASAVAAPLAVGVLAGLAVLGIGYGLAQLWGALNKPANLPPAVAETVAPAEVVNTTVKPDGAVGQLQVSWSSTAVGPDPVVYTAPDSVRWLRVDRQYHENKDWPGTTGWAYAVLGFNEAGTLVWWESFVGPSSNAPLLFDGPLPNPIPLGNVSYYFKPQGQPAVELLPLELQARAGTARLPQVEPEPAKAPPVVVPAPYVPPALPDAEPAVEPAPAQPARPTIAPPVVRPAPVPPAQTPERATPTTPAGQVQPAPQPPPARTPPTVHVINGTQIPANGPQATPQSMAQELGRIENKLAAMLDPKRAPTSDNPDRLGELLRTALNIYEILVGLTGEGSYTLSSPCELDANGDRIVQEVEFGAALSSVGLISNKLDALALLLQKHKDLKQPICRVTPSTGGQSVTVNFVQID